MGYSRGFDSLLVTVSYIDAINQDSSKYRLPALTLLEDTGYNVVIEIEHKSILISSIKMCMN